MNWAALAAIASLAGVICTIIGVAYTSGRVTQKLEDGRVRTDEHTRRLDEHSGRLGEHDVAIGRLEQWKEGYNAAVAAAQRGQS